LLACIEQNIKNSSGYRVMGQVVGYFYRHLREMFQNVTQISLSRYILMRKIAHAVIPHE